jgi:hypothetical protein
MSKKEDLEHLEEILGTPWICIVQLLMLNAKHQDSCIFLPFEINPLSIHIKHKSVSFFSLTWDASLNALYPPSMLSLKKFINMLRECSENNEGKYVVIPLLLENGSQPSGHFNVLIYDKEEKSVERYEPNGMITPAGYNTEEMDKKIVKFLSHVFLHDYRKEITYYKPEAFCPRKGVQYLEHMSRKDLEHLPFVIKRGTCSLWSIVYADERLSNPDLNRKQIHDKILSNIQNQNTNMYDFILSYLKNIYTVSTLLKSAKTTNEIIQYLTK